MPGRSGSGCSCITLCRKRGGRDTVAVHPICHRAIHAHFTNPELARLGGDRDALIAREAVANFVAWVRDKSPDFHAPIYRKR